MSYGVSYEGLMAAGKSLVDEAESTKSEAKRRRLYDTAMGFYTNAAGEAKNSADKASAEREVDYCRRRS